LVSLDTIVTAQPIVRIT